MKTILNIAACAALLWNAHASHAQVTITEIGDDYIYMIPKPVPGTVAITTDTVKFELCVYEQNGGDTLYYRQRFTYTDTSFQTPVLVDSLLPSTDYLLTILICDDWWTVMSVVHPADQPFTTTGPLGVATAQTDKLIVYPNPAEDVLTVAGAESGEILQLMDLSGRIVRTMQNSVEPCTMDVSGLQAGMYVLITSTQRHKIMIR